MDETEPDDAVLDKWRRKSGGVLRNCSTLTVMRKLMCTVGKVMFLHMCLAACGRQSD